jgi:hypothetical protein
MRGRRFRNHDRLDGDCRLEHWSRGLEGGIRGERRELHHDDWLGGKCRKHDDHGLRGKRRNGR